ncbi:MAG: hypothetical protein WBG50_18775 [Desulfomonilaceae bacterium]
MPMPTPLSYEFIFKSVSARGGKSRLYVAVTIVLIVVVLSTFPKAVPAAEFVPYPCPPPMFTHEPSKKSLIEGRFGYLWGENEIRFRDGDNDNIAPGKKELNVNGLIFGLQGETFLMDDLAVRAQAWINVPQSLRSDFLVEGIRRSWDTRAQFFEADLAAIYRIGLGGTPYEAGLTVGYRFENFDYKSALVASTGSFHDHIHVHIPYLGIYYAHSHFVGSVVRLDILASPLTLARVDAAQDLAGSITTIDGQSVTGFWFESFFGWSKPISSNAYLGIFVKYDHLELSGGATLQQGVASTRFSMDSWHDLVATGLSATYTF